MLGTVAWLDVVREGREATEQASTRHTSMPNHDSSEAKIGCSSDGGRTGAVDFLSYGRYVLEMWEVGRFVEG